MIRDGVHQINIEDWKVLERGFEGVSIVSQTTNNRKGAISIIAVSKKTKNAQKNHGLKKYALHKKQM